MSQHYFNTTYLGEPITVMMSWDKPLGYYFMTIKKSHTKLTDETEDNDPEKEYIYSNLYEENPFNKTLDDFKLKLEALDIVVPLLMFKLVEIDQMSNMGNMRVWHQAGNSIIEVE